MCADTCFDDFAHNLPIFHAVTMRQTLKWTFMNPHQNACWEVKGLNKYGTYFEMPLVPQTGF